MPALLEGVYPAEDVLPGRVGLYVVKKPDARPRVFKRRQDRLDKIKPAEARIGDQQGRRQPEFGADRRELLDPVRAQADIGGIIPVYLCNHGEPLKRS